jgi:SAM-dependent MidA family methyltransferase
MEVSLYSPETGYYEREADVIGCGGDYYTNVSTGSLFGSLLAFQFVEWLEQLTVKPVQLVECGAHNGQLAADILAFLGKNRPEFLQRLEYWLVEPSPRRQDWQAHKLANFARQTRWAQDLESLPKTGIYGVIFSNEWIDALPVRRIGWDASAQQWFEWGVSMHRDQFVWMRMPPLLLEAISADLNDAGIDFASENLAALPDGFTLELSPVAGRQWKQAASALRHGWLLTIDYGAPIWDLLALGCAQGTLRAYRQHHIVPDLLANPGAQDLTAHVNFTQLQNIGEAAGLQTEGLYSQCQFLTKIAQCWWKAPDLTADWAADQVRQFKILTHPDHLGRAFKVLVHSRAN